MNVRFAMCDVRRRVYGVLVCSLLSLVCGLSSFSAFAGGPLHVDVDRNGIPTRWPYDAAQKKYIVRWYYDKGPLTSGGRNNISNEQALKDWVRPIIDQWKMLTLDLPNGEHVQTVAIEFEEAGPVDEDITVDNYREYTDLTYDRYRDNFQGAVLIFDADGSILKDYGMKNYGEEGIQNRLVGVATPLSNSDMRLIQRGFAILNGRMIDGVKNNANNEIQADNANTVKTLFQAAILHEIGHLLNLDHSQVNLELASGCSIGSCDTTHGEAVVTMFPDLKTPEQFSLHRDDKIGLSLLYPTQAFTDTFCRIMGEVKTKEGKGMQGVNVVSMNVNDQTRDARSMTSGAYYPAHTEVGYYVLGGLIPGQDYEVVYEELSSHYNEKSGSSTIGKLGPDSPKDIGTGTIKGPDGKETVRCNRGGELITMPAMVIDTEAPPSTEKDPATSVLAEDSAGGSKGWCSLNPNARRQTPDAKTNSKQQIPNSFLILGFLICLGVGRWTFIVFQLLAGTSVPDKS